MPGGRVRLEFEDLTTMDAASAAFDNATRDDEALAIDVPSDGGFESLRSIVERLDRNGIEARALGIHTPDLDDVFFALTGRVDGRHGEGGGVMSALMYTLSDSLTMSRRNLVHAIRYPIIAYLIALPVIFLLLFVYVLGGTLGAGLPAGDTESYLQYVVPGVLLLSVAGGATGPAISVSQDLTEGIIARFRTMNISRSAVLAGHVIGNLLQLMIATIVVLGVALLMGFRAPADVWGWLGAVGVLTLIAFAMCWLGVAFGVFAKGVESASNLPMPIMILPLLGSGFVPTASMPAWLQWFAEVQPFTPFTETVRSLLFGTPIGMNGWLTLAWCAGITVVSWVWARFLYERKSVVR